MKSLLLPLGVVAFLVAGTSPLPGQDHSLAAPGVTSLTNPAVKYTVPPEHHVTLRRGPITAMVVDNEAIDIPELPAHRAGYNGLASLKHDSSDRNLFVPGLAGLNYEHIHDGTLAVAAEKFEPRRAPMELRVIDDFTVELHQLPSPNWKLESCGRYHLRSDGTIEYTFECIPRAATFQQGFIGLFWASYIAAPEDKAIQFRGRPAGATEGVGDWLRTVTASHGVDSTHPPAGKLPDLPIHPNFPLTLVNHRSPHVWTDPWYFGVSHGLAFVQSFRAEDGIWFAQSPTGGGADNPAWDFQWFIPDWKIGEAYGFVMRAALIPYENPSQVEEATREMRESLK